MTESKFSEMGILVHASFTPTPLDYGQLQTCTVGVPWPNEVFYYALVAFDAAGNRSPISNVISVYIYEAPTTTTTSGRWRSRKKEKLLPAGAGEG